MERGDIVTASVKEIAAGGAGLASVEGMKVFIAMTAPGDTVRARIIRKHKNWAAAELAGMLEPSPLRKEPACPLYGICGGCSLQHLLYESQLEAKTAILKNAFTRIGRTGIPLLDAAASPPWEYRNRVRLHRAGKNLPAGFKAEGSGSVIPAADCPVAENGVRAALKRGTFPQRECFTIYSRNGLFLCEGGLERGRTRLLDQEITLDAGVFFQSNAVMLEKLIADLLETAESAPAGLPAADIYCGVGTFALFLKDRFSRVDLVEENRAALELARENVQGKGIAFFAMKDEDWVKMKNGGKTGGTEDYGFVVADPPRRGLSPGMRRWLAAKGPPLFAYVSCDPATMARDSGELVREYDLEKVYLYDFYPQTAHIESMGVFRRKGGT